MFSFLVQEITVGVNKLSFRISRHVHCISENNKKTSLVVFIVMTQEKHSQSRAKRLLFILEKKTVESSVLNMSFLNVFIAVLTRF